MAVRKKNAAVIDGSQRGAPLFGAEIVGSIAAEERFEVTIRVRRKAGLATSRASGVQGDIKPAQRVYLSRGEYAEQYGASAEDIAAVEAFARADGLVVVESSEARRSVFVSGTTADFAAAFGARIGQYEHGGGSYRGRTGELTVPAELAGLIEGVFGIDNRPVAQPHFQRSLPKPSFGIQPHAASAPSFLPTTLAALYGFPAGADGTGQCIAIIELGGGYRKVDIDAYFVRLGLPSPDVRTVSVDGGRNQPSSAESADGEVMLDVLIAAAVAPKAKIVVYFAPNTDKGFLDALTMAVHDQSNKPSVISISWGSAEVHWTAQAMSSFDQALQTAAALGVTVCAASGDNGSGDGVDDGMAHVDFPASSPFMLACGGTRLVASGGVITSETVWNEGPDSATGGGISDFFPRPAYQAAINIPGSANGGGNNRRALPDVSANADPKTGYEVRVDGQDMVIGGTSAVAPLWAGLVALLNQELGHPVGFLNPLIYSNAFQSSAFRDIASGDNGAYAASAGWDACTGWGSPDGATLLSKLR